MITKCSWSKIGDIGKRLILQSFDVPSPPIWEKYFKDHLKYWNFDDPKLVRAKRFLGDDITLEKFEKKERKEFEKYKDYRLHWNGVCKIGESVEVIPIEPDVIVLSKNWKGEVSDHSDLEIELKQERGFMFRHIKHLCVIYSFGTLAGVEKGDINNQLGEAVRGDTRISHKKGMSEEQEMPVIHSGNTIKIRDAVFKIVR